MALFALMDNQVTTKVLRIKLDKKSSAMVDQAFKDQKQHFETHHDNIIDFHAGYTPTYDECFVLNDFVEARVLIDAVTRNTAIKEWDPTTIDIKHIKALFVGVESPGNNKIIAVQTFNKKQILDTSKSFLMGLVAAKNTFSKADNVGFNIDDKITTYINDDKVYFKSFFKMRSLFDMTRYFEEATDDDVDDFANDPIFSTQLNFNLKSVSDSIIRTKITLIKQSGILNAANIPALKDAARKIRFPLQTIRVGNAEKIVIPDVKREIKALLDFLDEDIFTSEVTQKIFKSTSKRPYI
ncbi:DUF4868 domain-containing protein [Pantoea agglomerans]|nr:Kiwa anti-phage protein KwaB-like domain-containing protein [Pantoea agglomerans]WIL43092.1 DUF4868 domain-containing protein [Pantoea agglomerans]